MEIAQKILNPKLHKKQKEVLRLLFNQKNDVSEILFGGGAGGGKSYVGCLWILINCLKYDGTRWLIGRANLSTLRQTTLATFFEICKKFGIKEGEHYKYNQQYNYIRFKNDSEIILKDLQAKPSDPSFDSLGSLEIAGAFIDECNQVTEKAKNIVMSRIRHKLDEYGLMPKLLLTCNPARNWVYEQFYKKKKDGKLENYKEFIQSLVTDNPYISKHYITNLKRQDIITQKRLLFGEWEYENLLALFQYDNVIEMCEQLQTHSTPLTHYITVDVARLGKDKTCVVVWSDFNVIEIHEWEKMTLDVQAQKIEFLKDRYGVQNSHIIIDSDGVGGGLVDMLPGSTSILNNSKPFDQENYYNLKTQLYFRLAEKVNSNQITFSSLNEDQRIRLVQELCIVQREQVDKDGKIKMTSKEQIRQLIGRSPDLADSLAYRMYFDIRSKTWDYEIEVFEW